MISRKASYKAFTNIPSRRKPQTVPAVVKTDEVKAEEIPNNSENAPSAPESPVENINKPIDVNENAEQVVKNPECSIEEKSEPSKTAIRRIKPVVNIPSKRPRVPNIEIINQELSQIQEQTKILAKLGESSQSESEPELSSLKSPVKNRFPRPGPLLRPSEVIPEPNRVRKISEHVTNVSYTDETLENVKKRKPKSNQYARKMAEARRMLHTKLINGEPDRSVFTMFDFVLYNPPSSSTKNNFEKDEVEKVKKKYEEKSEKEKILREEEEEDALLNGEADNEEEEEGSAIPAPRVKVGANGEIVLDEKSLVIETNDAKKAKKLFEKPVLFESRNEKKACLYPKLLRRKDWTISETKFFYRALNTIGTDFSSMVKIFPDRTRNELKNKFKLEERENAALVRNALGNPTRYDIDQLKEEIDKEREVIEEDRKKELLKRQKVKPRRAKAEYRKRCLSSDISEEENDEEQLNITRKLRRRRASTLDFKKLLGEDDNEDDGLDVTKESLTEAYERRTDVSDSEFISALDKNLKNMKTSTVRVQMDEAENVQVIMDLEENEGDAVDGTKSSGAKQQDKQRNANIFKPNSYVYLSDSVANGFTMYKMQEVHKEDGSTMLMAVPLHVQSELETPH